jgi:hypothetical protein
VCVPATFRPREGRGQRCAWPLNFDSGFRPECANSGKTNALYYEFEEIGLNRQLGYESPADLVDKYPQFYWDKASPYIQNAIRYLNVTSSGRQWINCLYSNVFRAEHELRLFGPQP